jgi:signal transduction histidine kinase
VTGDGQRELDSPDDGNARLAAIIRAASDTILTSLQEKLDSPDDSTCDVSPTPGFAVSTAAAIIADVTESVTVGDVRVGEHDQVRAAATGEAVARGDLDPNESLEQAVALFNLVINSLAPHVRNDPELLPAFVLATRALSESTATRIKEVIDAYTGWQLDRIRQAHLEERRRIARELHDRLGEGFSVALRQIELYELLSKEGYAAPPPTAPGKEAIEEGMRRLRVIISDLRHEPVLSLEKALSQYIESMATSTVIEFQVHGDENLVPPAVVEEVYLIVREAIRNALTHGKPNNLIVRMAVTERELSIAVADDGCGFEPVKYSKSASYRTGGLASMRERTQLIGGKLTISSTLSRGTRIELLVPLADSPFRLAKGD